MKFFSIESTHSFVNIDNVCEVQFKDDGVCFVFTNMNLVEYTLTNEERK